MTTITQYSDKDKLLSEVVACYNRFKRAGWEFLIRLREALDELASDEQERTLLLEQIAYQTDLKVETLKKYYRTAKSEAAKTALELGLTFHHAEVVYHLDPEHAISLLHDAAENQWQPAKLSKEAHGYTSDGFKSVFQTPPVVTQNGASASATRHLSEMISDVNRSKVLTTIGATLRPNMTEKESVALATYGHVTSDMLNWTRGDIYNRIEDDTQQLSRRRGWKLPEVEEYLEGKLDELARDYQTDTDTILRNAATARAFPVRTQTATIGYAHHELLRNKGSEEAAGLLDLAGRNGWTVQQLDKHLHPHPSVSDEVLGIIKHADKVLVHGNTITITSGKLRLFITTWRIEAT